MVRREGKPEDWMDLQRISVAMSESGEVISQCR